MSDGEKLFFCLLDIAIYNSFVLYTQSEQDGRKMKFLQYRIQLSKKLLMDASSQQTFNTQTDAVVAHSLSAHNS